MKIKTGKFSLEYISKTIPKTDVSIFDLEVMFNDKTPIEKGYEQSLLVGNSKAITVTLYDSPLESDPPEVKLSKTRKFDDIIHDGSNSVVYMLHDLKEHNRVLVEDRKVV